MKRNLSAGPIQTPPARAWVAFHVGHPRSSMNAKCLAVATTIKHTLNGRIHPIRTNVEGWTVHHPEEATVALGRAFLVRVVGDKGTVPLLDESLLDPFRHVLPKPGSIGAEELTAMIEAHLLSLCLVGTTCAVVRRFAFGTSVGGSATRSSPSLVEDINLNVEAVRFATTKESRCRAGTSDASPDDGHLETPRWRGGVRHRPVPKGSVDFSFFLLVWPSPGSKIEKVFFHLARTQLTAGGSSKQKDEAIEAIEKVRWHDGDLEARRIIINNEFLLRTATFPLTLRGHTQIKDSSSNRAYIITQLAPDLEILFQPQHQNDCRSLDCISHFPADSIPGCRSVDCLCRWEAPASTIILSRTTIKKILAPPSLEGKRLPLNCWPCA